MKKRTFLKAGLVAGVGSLAAGSAFPSHAAGSRMGAPPSVELSPLMKPLLNKAQAHAVMEEHDLSGMLALNPINVYYLTNTSPIGVGMRWEYPSFASIARGPDIQTFLITSSVQLWDLARGVHWAPEVIYYSGVQNSGQYMGPEAKPLSVEPEAFGGGRFPFREGADLTPREQAWSHLQANVQPLASPEWALARALKESGIVKGRVAVDDMRIAHLLNRIGAAEDIEFVDGDNLFRHIRVIKSDVEIELMRHAAQKNAAAAVATMHSIERGMEYEDIRRIFMAEAGARGNRMAFMVAGNSPLGDFPRGVVESGMPFLMDAVSEFHGYHGDFARSIVVGEPSREFMARTKAQQVARLAALETVKPGTKYSEVRTAALSAYEKAGGEPGTLLVGPHSVGLQHTDQPYDDKNPWRGGYDITLQAGMTITIDLPCIEIGFGTGHNEDLVLVTKDGYELLNSPDEPLVII